MYTNLNEENKRRREEKEMNPIMGHEVASLSSRFSSYPLCTTTGVR
jgi:hypothetical protein